MRGLRVSLLVVTALGCSRGTSGTPPVDEISSALRIITPGHGPLVVGTTSNGAGTFLYTPDTPNQFPLVGPFAPGDAVASGDLDHDGVPEVLIGLANGDVDILEQSGTIVSPASVGLPGPIPFFQNGSLAVGDVNGDGFGDVVVVEPNVNSGFGEVLVFTSHGAPQISSTATSGLPVPPGAALVVCDLNHDGFSDILVAPSFLMYSGATGKIQSYQPTLPFFNAGSDKLACADLNGDGFDDVVIAHPEGGGAGFFQVLTDPALPPIDFFPNGFPPFDLEDDIAAGDLDGDGLAELAIGHIPLPSPGTAGPLVGDVSFLSAPGKAPPQRPTFLTFLPGDKLAVSNAHALPSQTTTDFTIPYVISFLMYEPPGDKSSVGYQMGTTLGSTTQVTTSTKEGVSVNANIKLGPIGAGGGATVTFTQTTTDTATFSSTVTSGVTMQASGGQDVPDHNLDQFFVVFDSHATALDLHDGHPPNVTIDMSTGTLNKLTAGQLLEIANGQPSSIQDPTLLALVVKDIKTPADANQILAADPFFANVDPAQDTDRFAPLVPVGQSSNTVKFLGPSGPNVGPVTNTYSAANMTGSSHGTGNSVDFSEKFSISAGLSADLTLGFGYSRTRTDSTSTTTTDTITVGTDHVCFQGTVDLFRDLDFGGSILTKTNLTNPCQQQPMQMMSFEALPDWQIQGGGSAVLSPNAVTGAEAFSITAGSGWTPMVSQPLSSALLRSAATSSDLSKVSFALDIPARQPNPFWIGAAQMYVTAPSANVFNAYMGQIELTPLPKDQFVRLAFSVPDYALHALTEDHGDVSFTIVLNVNAGTSGWLVDDLTIGG
jgi:hypothetical protein